MLGFASGVTPICRGAEAKKRLYQRAAKVREGYQESARPQRWHSMRTTSTSTDESADLSARLDTLTVSTPELSTWAMMLIGFAGLSPVGGDESRTGAEERVEDDLLAFGEVEE